MKALKSELAKEVLADRDARRQLRVFLMRAGGAIHAARADPLEQEIVLRRNQHDAQRLTARLVAKAG